MIFCSTYFIFFAEVITSAKFHPTHCNMLAYNSSKGSIRLIDLRQSTLCDTHTKLFEEQEALGARSFFMEIIASISDIKFGKDGRHILSRDYMTLKVHPTWCKVFFHGNYCFIMISVPPLNTA